MHCNLKSLETVAGKGVLAFRKVRGRTALIRARATSPLTLLNPRSYGRCAWAVCGTHGGGLVGGDNIQLDVVVESNASAMIGTQASTKVYRCDGGLRCRQSLDARVEENALLVLVPDPVTCFADASYAQEQRIELHESASLLMIDWFTSGRYWRGERWAMTDYNSRSEVLIDGRLVFRDALRLDAADGLLASPARMGRFNCFATVLMIGAEFASFASELLRLVAGQPLVANAKLVFAGGPAAGGALLRVAGESTETVGNWLRDRLAFLSDITGQDPWARKR
ncbi:MAG: urease accessory protein UreD [Planctomycetota bacterium]|nr:urease accessory protein UreD [Planctomycetota bacterium]